MDSISEILTGAGFAVLDFRADGSLLRPEAATKLADALGANSNSSIALIAPMNTEDFAHDETDALLHQFARARFVDAQANLRRTLKQMQEQNRRSIFIGDGNCIGSWWDASLWFKWRFWQTRMGSVGGFEFANGMFGSSGGLLGRLIQNPKHWNQFTEYPLVDVAHAVRQKVIDAVGDVSTLPMFLSLVQAQEKAAQPRIEKVQKAGAARKSLFSRFRSTNEAPVDFSRCENARQMYELVRKLGKPSIEDSVFESMMSLANSQMLMRKNLTMILSQNSKNALQSTADKLTLRSVQLKATSLAPPVALLLAAHRQQLNVLICGESASELSRMSETISTRLGRVLSPEVVAEFCANKLLCFSAAEAAPCTPQTVQLIWTVDDRLLLRTHERVCEVYCVSGSDHRGSVQFVEAAADLDSEDEAKLSVLGMRTLRSPTEKGYLTVKIRSKLIDVVLKMATDDGISIEVIVDALHSAGWRFMGERKLLDRFIRYHYSGEYYSQARSGTTNDLEQLLAISRSRNRPAKTDVQTRLNIPQSFLHAFAAIVDDFLQSLDHAEDQQLLRATLAEAAGLPDAAGSIEVVLDQIGQRRLAAIKEQHSSIVRSH